LPLATALWAQEQGRLRELRHAFYEAFFCEGEDIATDPEIRRAAERAELDPDAALAAAYDPARIEQLAAVRARADELGARGVPTLVADGATHWGTGGVERLLAGRPLVPRPA
jgi:2-hydroxychromene-2-carboxylate isomerase